MRSLIFAFFVLVYGYGIAQPNIQFGYQLHHAGAAHLAIDTLHKAIAFYKTEKDYQKVGDAYQTLAEVYYDAGYLMQFTHAIDTFYHYKTLAFTNEPIYFVEYAAWKARALAIDHDYELAIELVDSAFTILKKNRKKASLVDTSFLHLNYLNLCRNRSNGLAKLLEGYKFGERTAEVKIKVYHDAIKRIPIDNNPFQNAIYQRYFGNFNQDHSRPNPLLTANVTDGYRDRALYHYEKGIIGIEDSLGYANTQAIWLKMLVAWQYAKIEEHIKADSIYRSCFPDLQIHVNGKTYYRQLNLPQFFTKWFAANGEKLNNPQLEYYTSQLETTWRVRRLYANKYMELSKNTLREGYELNPSIDIMRMQVLNDSNRDYGKLWDYFSSQVGYEAYFESIQNLIGKAKYSTLTKQLDSIDYDLLLQLDRLFLMRKGATLIYPCDSNTIKAAIIEIDNAFYEVLDGIDPILKRFCENKSAIPLNQFVERLPEDQAVVLYSNKTIFNEENIAFFISKTHQKIFPISYEFEVFFDSLFLRTDAINFDNIKDNSFSYWAYQNYIQPIDSLLAGIQKIKIIGLRGNAIPFEIFSDNENETFESSTNKLIKKYSFTYSQNISADIINTKLFSTKNENGVIFSNCSNNSKNQETPFMETFSMNLASIWKTNFQKSITQLEHLKYNHLLIVSHGTQINEDKDLRYLHDFKEELAKNNIHFCDSSYSPLDIDNLELSADFVTLISCQTADGRNTRLTGKYDFTWAFLKNGSKTILASPYELDDKTTAYILQQFFAYLEEGFWASEALQKAKLDFIRLEKDPVLNHPKYWAGLMLYGNDYKLPNAPIYEKWWFWVLCFLVISVGTFFILKNKRSKQLLKS